MSETERQEIKELAKQVGEMQLTLARFQSHLESELGNNTRGLNDLKKDIEVINNKVFGKDSNSGIIIDVDRLKQSDSRNKIWQKAFVGSTAAIIVKFVYDLVSSMP